MNSRFPAKTILAAGLGAAVFLVLFLYVKIPSPVPETSIQIAYGVSSFVAAVFGPPAGFFAAFAGHALSDFVSYGSPWWSWVAASGVSGLITGICSKTVGKAVQEGRFAKRQMIQFIIFALIANAAAWVAVAPVLDIVIYSEPAQTVFLQGMAAFIFDAFVSCVFGILLLKAYASLKKGSLSKKN